MSLRKLEFFRQAVISSASVDLGITGKVCLKSPANNLNVLPKGFEFPHKSCNDRSRASSNFSCAIVHSSQIISLHCCNSLPIPNDSEMLFVGVSVDCIFRGNLKAE